MRYLGMFLLGVLLSSGTLRAQSALISPESALPLGLERMWFANFSVDRSRGRIAGLQLHVSSSEAHTVFSISYDGKRYAFSERDRNAFGEIIGVEGARLKAEEKLAEISAALDKLWSKMSADGVKDVIYIQYSEDAGATPKENRGQGKPIPICQTGPIICHTLATTDLVMGQLLDGIHPTAAANTRIAKALLKMMEERKVRR